MKIKNPLGMKYNDLILPDNTFVVKMKTPSVIANPAITIANALEHPIDCDPLSVVASKKLEVKRNATACVVVSDNTRPVPYRGEEGILLPIIETLLKVGYQKENILILVATGTHRVMMDDELKKMIDSRIFSMGIKIVNHDCDDDANLVYKGVTSRGTHMYLDKRYVEADLKIATGLVESHFMAGASGGRKAICPGLIGKASTYVFHGPAFMADPNSRDLNLEGNPVHEESLEVASTIGVDFLVNVTLDQNFHVTGIFCGALNTAHLAAVEMIKKTVRTPVPHEADIVITHGGFVGINHYQCAKCGVASLGVLKENGYLVVIANLTDKGNVVGSINYRTTVALLKLQGADGYVRTISSPDWTFIPEQWQVQMWAKVFKKIPMDHMLFYAPQLNTLMWQGLPGVNAALFVGDNPGSDCFSKAVSGAISYIEKKENEKVSDLNIIYIPEGPYVVPYVQGMD
ncbi:MAG: nickel-dependent lactate racemase [Sphaerochaetaceae bacterium]